MQKEIPDQVRNDSVGRNEIPGQARNDNADRNDSVGLGMTVWGGMTRTLCHPELDSGSPGCGKGFRIKSGMTVWGVE